MGHANPHQNVELLKAYGLGKIEGAAADTIAQHLETCVECRTAVAAASAKGPAQGSQAVGASPQALKAQPPERGPTVAEAIPSALAASPDYEVIREISRGGMGVVYLARNRRMDRLEGLKVVKQALLARAGALERFEREMRSAARLSHPNIVTAFSSPPLEGLLAFAMEYVDGIDLYQLVKTRGPLPISNACYYVSQAAKGLQHACEREMVHRDIKPNNLMLMLDGKKQVIKILDFGLAKATSENPIDAGLTREGQMLGTPHYMAPEQSIDAAKADIRADIYSLGCTLYYLLTGHPPFQDKESLYEILHAHQRLEVPPLNALRSDVPAELVAIVARMMAKEPAQRYQQPAEVAQALAPYFNQGVKPIPTGTNRFTAPPPGSAPPETASSKAAEATRQPTPFPAGPAPVGSGGTGPAQANEPGTGTSDGTNPMQTMLELVVESESPSSSRHSGRSTTRRVPSKNMPPKLWVGVAAGILLLCGLGLWANGVFTKKAKTGERTRVVKLKDPDATSANVEEGETEEVSSARPERNGDNPIAIEESRVAQNTSAPEPPDMAGDDASVTPVPASDNVSRNEPAWPADAVAFGPKRFKLFTDHLNWHAAQKKCLELGGRLAEVRSQAENDFLIKLVTGTKVDGIWLGATDEAEERRWLWSDGAPLSYASWDEGQPNNVGEGGEHYLMLLVSNWTGKWWDQPATSGRGLPAGWKVGYVCEWAAAGNTAQAPPTIVRNAGAMVPFFNGKDLTGWIGLPGYWQVRDGAIVGAPAKGVKQHTFLCSQRSYKDFEIKFLVRSKSGIGNSGVQFRSQVTDLQKYTVVGPQMEIDSADSKFPPGSALNEPDAKPGYASNRDVVNDIWVNDDFNRMHLRCVGKHVTVKLRGIVVLDIEYPSIPDEGIIAWQLNGYKSPDEVTFKDIQFADLTRGDSPLEAAAPPTAGKDDGSRPHSDDPIMGRLKNAKAVYEAARDQYREGVNKHFDRRGEAARKQGKKKLVDQIKAERTAFEQRGDLPLSAPAELKRKIASARSAMESAYAAAVRDYTKAKNDSESSAVEKELEQFKRDQDAAWVPLFNGKDTRGWHASAALAKANWQVVGGTLIGSGEGGLLITDRRDYQNFRLRVEAMLTEGADSGVFFRAQDERLEFAYEAEIGSFPGGNTGGFGVFDRGVKGIASAPQPVPVGQWSTMDILAEDNRFTIWVDGTQTAKHEDKERRFSKGAIAIQQFGGPKQGVVSFRKIDIKELPSK